MRKVLIVLLPVITLVALSAGCGKKTPPVSQADCYTTYPKDVPGLVIRGPRPRRNIIENMTPIVCGWRDLCTQRNRTDLTGTIFVTILVNKVGELGVLEYTHTTPDSALVSELVEGIYMRDFDPWYDDPDDTEFDYPIVLFGK